MRRFIFLIGFGLIFTSLFIINWLCLLLDNLLFPGFRKVKVKKPLFITGLTRTGSTLLFNSLHQNNVEFTSMKLWEIILAPSIIQRKVIHLVTSPKPVYRILSRKVLPYIEEKFFKNLEDIHTARFLEIEEDEFVFYHIFSSGSLFFLFPRIRHFLKYSRFDDAFSKKARARAMNFYRGIIKRHLYYHGKEKTYLSKSPGHTARILSLREAFPGMNCIYLVRDPAKTIPSTFSLFSAIREGNQVPITDLSEFLDDGLDLAEYWLRHPLNLRGNCPKLSMLIIHSEDLFKKPVHTIEVIHREFAYRYPDIYKEKLLNENRKRFKSSHDYNLREFGLSEKIIHQRFNNVYHALLEEKYEI